MTALIRPPRAPYVAPKRKRVRFEPHRYGFGVSERIGTGATHSILSLKQRKTALSFLEQRALDYLNAGYAVTWHDGITWFVAEHPSKPRAFVTITEVD